jgi:multimeric flavodoxin WrbA/nitrite reductase/ring-hydroxylating ferredoxin subunit
MSESSNWVDLGPTKKFISDKVTSIKFDKTTLAIIYKEEKFGIISGVCNHAGGPLGEGKLDGNYVVCPWHYWKFHFQTGKGEPGYEEDRVPSYLWKVENGHLFVELNSATKRSKKPHEPHPLARPVKREPGHVRFVGISTTVMNKEHPRYSTSDFLLEMALNHAKEKGCETKLIKLNDLHFRSCEGYYSKSARACTWPCSITQMDATDELDQVYEAFVHWGDAFILSTPIRWGVASSLYYKMVERMNCIQNQETIAGKHLLKNKIAGFIITGGQDNVQAVAGSMLGFFSEIGCQFPQFPYVAHTRGWNAEDMENNINYVKTSKLLHDGVKALTERLFSMADMVISGKAPDQRFERGGRKANK